MLGIQSEILRDVAFMVIGSLVAAAFAGFSLLKSYEEFKKGVEKKSRLRIWSAFVNAAFLVILFITAITYWK
jgi:hypothetical protein